MAGDLEVGDDGDHDNEEKDDGVVSLAYAIPPVTSNQVPGR